MKLRALKMILSQLTDEELDEYELTIEGRDHFYHIAFAELRNAAKISRHSFEEINPGEEADGVKVTKVLLVL